MLRISILTPVLTAVFLTAAFAGATGRADAHLTVCNSTPNDLAIAEAFSTPKGSSDTNSAVLVARTKCVNVRRRGGSG